MLLLVAACSSSSGEGSAPDTSAQEAALKLALAPIGCAWRAVGVLDARYLASKWNVRC